jgi:sulfate adenylyltransferase subunit 2
VRPSRDQPGLPAAHAQRPAATSITFSPAAPAATRAAPAIIAAPAGHPSFLIPRESEPMENIPMNLTHLQRLEAESIHIMREVVAESDKPGDAVFDRQGLGGHAAPGQEGLLPLAAALPAAARRHDVEVPRDVRDARPHGQESGMELLVYQNPEAAELGINPFTHGSQIHTDMWKTQGLKQALDKYGFDARSAAPAATRRSRAPRSASSRSAPRSTAGIRRTSAPSSGACTTAASRRASRSACFPISNWTELDIWQYIYLENVPIVPLYFAAERPVVDRDGTLIMVDDDRMPLRDGEVPMMKSVRFRTLGCYPLSGAVESEADTLPAIIQEMLLTKTSERQGRMIDHDAAASMEKKKQEGYF